MSPGILPPDPPQCQAFLDAMSSLKKLRGNSQAMVHPMENEDKLHARGVIGVLCTL